MPIMYKNTKYAITFEPCELDQSPHGAEQEHKDSCDINKMMRSLDLGHEVRGQKHGLWVDGVTDDLTMDAVQFRIQKAELEEELRLSAQHELDEEAQSVIPESIQKQFGLKFKKKKKADTAKKNDKPNDEKLAETPSNLESKEPE